jgi:polysaccharide export outer membrane protein
MPSSRSLNAVAAMALLAACATSGSSIPVNDYEEPPDAPQSGYVIAAGDVLQVRVFNQPDISTRVRVRDDGKVSIPLLNDVTAVGLPPNALAQQIQTRLKEFMNAPVVTVSLEEARTFSISIIGEVNKAGMYALPPGSGVLQALAAAGGLTQYASKDKIFVVRETPSRARIRFEFDQLTQGGGKASTFRLRLGDIVVVE